MQLKYCIAKMVGTEPVYMTDTVNTWVSDINSPDVLWFAFKLDAEAARDSTRDCLCYVAPYEHIDTQVRVDALTRACEALAEAIRVGAVESSQTEIEVPYEVFKSANMTQLSEFPGEIYVTHSGFLNGVKVKAFKEKL